MKLARFAVITFLKMNLFNVIFHGLYNQCVIFSRFFVYGCLEFLCYAQNNLRGQDFDELSNELCHSTCTISLCIHFLSICGIQSSHIFYKLFLPLKDL